MNASSTPVMSLKHFPMKRWGAKTNSTAICYQTSTLHHSSNESTGSEATQVYALTPSLKHNYCDIRRQALSNAIDISRILSHGNACLEDFAFLAP
jgi:hypothetical protein